MVEHMLDSLHLILTMFIMIIMMMMTMVMVKQLTTPWLATMSATLATTSFPALLLLSSVVGEGKKNRGEDDLGTPITTKTKIKTAIKVLFHRLELPTCLA